MTPTRASAQRRFRAPRNDNRRQLLLDAAARCFAGGYHGTSMRDIAKATGMLPGSIYYHFTSKEELLLAVYEHGVKRIAERVDAAIERETEPWGKLEAAAVAHLEALLRQSDYTRVMIRVPPEEAGGVAERLRELRDQYEERFRRLVAELPLPPRVDRRYFRLLLIGGLNWSHVWYRPGKDAPATIARRMLAVIRQQLEPARVGAAAVAVCAT